MATIIIFPFLLVSLVDAMSIPLDGRAASNTTEPKQGWTQSPNVRGTYEIIWSCAITMILCSWSILCLNVPGPDDSGFKVIRRKVYITALAFMGPEFIFQLALAQYVSARQSVQDFHEEGYLDWTLPMAFFVDMGGFVLHTPDFPPFPIDAKQLLYLIRHRYIELPSLGSRSIKDKNKVDGFLRLITLAQITWFLIDLLGRGAQHLAITCAELTTAAFVVASIGTTICWMRKPADVTEAELIYCETSIAEILIQAGDDAAQPWSYTRTPLDFVSREEWHWSKNWSHWINILRHMGIVFGSPARPVDRIENTLLPALPGHTPWMAYALVTVYFGVLLLGWNFSFPTTTELWLWRAASLGMAICFVMYVIVTESVFVWWPAIKNWISSRDAAGQKEEEVAEQEEEEESAETKARAVMKEESRVGADEIRRKQRTFADRLRNNSVSKDPALYVPLKVTLPFYVVGFIYCCARIYTFLADALQLRSLPASAFETVDWSEWVPHYA